MRCDVLVIGAGPGGSTAAYWLSRFGADVLLVDKAHFPRNKPCGDALGPGVEEMLKAMNLGGVLESSGCKYCGLRLFFPREAADSSTEYEELHLQTIAGWTVPRFLLDDALRRNAISAGARFLGGFTARNPLYQNRRLTGISGEYKGQYETIQAPLIIVATGANRRLLQAMGFVHADNIHTLAIRMYIPHLEGMEDCLQVYLDEELFPAYAWVFPGPDGCANVGCGISLQQLTSSAASRRLRLAMRRFMNKVLTADQALPSTLFPPNLQGFPLRSDFPRIPLYQQGAMVVGEAAGLVDPITGEGIYTAMRSGWLAARVAGYALESGDFSVEPLKVYSEIVREWYGDDYQSAQNIMSWLAQPGIERSLIHQAKENQQVRQGLEKAFLEKRLAEGLATLQAAVTLPG